MAEVKKFNLEEFKKTINTDKLVAVFFYSDFAAPCRAMKDVINSTAEMLNGHITFGMVNVNDLKDLFVIYDIKSVPTIVVFEEGKPVERIEGYIPFTTLGNQLSKKIK